MHILQSNSLLIIISNILNRNSGVTNYRSYLLGTGTGGSLLKKTLGLGDAHAVLCAWLLEFLRKQLTQVGGCGAGYTATFVVVT